MTKRSSVPIMMKLTLAAFMLILGSCSSTPKPILEIANAETEINEAKKFKAETYAPEEFKLAETNLQSAKDAMAIGRNLEARWYAEKAISDAEYAKVKATAITFKALAEKQEEMLKKLLNKSEQKQDKEQG